MLKIVRAVWDETRLEKAKNFAQIAGLIVAVLYFGFRWATGFRQESVSLDIVTHRIHDPKNPRQDLLEISLLVKNGANYHSLRIHDIALQVISEVPETVTQEPADTPSPEPIRVEGRTRHEVVAGKFNFGTPNKLREAGLGPGSQNEFATFVRVRRNVPCLIEAAVLVKRSFNWGFAQSLSSAVSLPIVAGDEHAPHRIHGR